jgi:hypothetical protein
VFTVRYGLNVLHVIPTGLTTLKDNNTRVLIST